MNVKICGLSTPETTIASAQAGARYVGFAFVEKSKRFVTLEKAAELALLLPPGVSKVALTMDAEDAYLDAITDQVPVDMIQLHGAETPERVAEVRQKYGLPVIKALGVADETDLAPIAEFSRVADQILVDAKPPRSGALPGGNGVSFDWKLITGRRWAVPWMLSGGLTPENVAEAIRLTGAPQVDVSSGVESGPGVKDTTLIEKFVSASLNA